MINIKPSIMSRDITVKNKKERAKILSNKKTIICQFCKEPLNEMEIEEFEKDGKLLCYNWENEY